ncbi:MAG TPA: hypothetical protein EYP10_14735, partial [Armatimonadetes bacterium]|nr:hypothetical protein [Armatimonadota bacterium]
PIAGAFVNVSLKHAQTGRTVKLMSGRTNSFGTLEQSFTVPSWATGRNELAIKVRTSIGEDEVKEAIIVRDEARIMLTTDKPLYQPSQVIHMRALCLHPATLKPVASVRVTFEVEDPKGNKVFRKRVQTSRFGIASVDFQLADEINLGNYTVRAIAQRQGSKGGWRTIGEVTQTVKVDRYVLPKFKVALETKKRFYLPGDEFEGVIKANYFFGKPVAGGEVLIKLSSFDVKWSDFAELRGRTDENGVYRFKHRLPTYFVGQPLEQGKALLKVEVRVTDKAEHEEHITETFPVAKEAISVVVIPESQSIARDVANTLFIVTTYPDGTPAKTKVTVSGKGIKWSGATDAMGIAEMQFVPRSERVRFTVKARDAQGNVGHLVKAFERKVNEEAIILRTNKAIAKIGDVLKLTILSTRRGGTVYLDAIRGRQTVLTKAIELNGARRAVRLPLTEQMMGTLTLHAYRITRTGHIIRDTKVTYVNPATDLRIAVKPDRKTYLPGGRAQVDFAVTDAQGHPVLAALGITIVDESVYALQEMQPGLEKVYFMLEREIMKPRYEIHGFEPLRILRERPPMPRVEARPVALDETRERAARVLFAAAMPNLHTLHVNTWKVRAEKLREKWLEHGRKVYKRIWNALARYHKRHGEYPAPDEAIDALVREKFITRRDTLDPLGNPYRIKAHGRGWGRRVWSFVLISAGPDGKFGTDDDVRVLPLVFAKGDVRVQAIREMPLR